MIKFLCFTVVSLVLLTSVSCDMQRSELDPASELPPAAEVDTGASALESSEEPALPPDDQALEYLKQLNAQLNGTN